MAYNLHKMNSPNQITGRNGKCLWSTIRQGLCHDYDEINEVNLNNQFLLCRCVVLVGYENLYDLLQ